jgi:hypothetical protein
VRGVSEEDAKENIWLYEQGSNKRWRKFPHDECHNLYPSRIITVVIRLTRMTLAGHVTWLGEMRSPWGGRRIILKWNLRKSGERIWNGFIWLRIGTTGRLFLRTRINILGSINCKEFLYQVSD